MKVRPMLGQYEIAGIEWIESAERRALVEHRVPGMEGSYLQDLGSAPNAIVIAGTRFGDDARDAFLDAVRALFNSGAPTTFVADINTATDVTDVVIEDLQVAEVAGDADAFRYVLTLRKYVQPPVPAAAGLPGLDSDLLEQAAGLVNALDALDALGSIPDLGDPTPPLRGALDGVRGATSDLEPAAADAEQGLGAAAERAQALPAPEQLGETLAGVQGRPAGGTGMTGALEALQGADVPGRRGALLDTLDGAVAGLVPTAGAAPGTAAVDQIAGAAAELPQPESLAAPLTEPLAQLGRLTGPEAAGAVPAAIETLSGLADGAPADPGMLLAGAAAALGRLEQSALAGRAGTLGEWSDAIAALASALAEAGAGALRERLFAFLRDEAAGLAAQVLPGGAPAAAFAGALEAATAPARLGVVRGAAEDVRDALASVAADPAAAEAIGAAEQALARLAEEAAALTGGVDAALRHPAATADGLASTLAAIHRGLAGVEVVDLSRLPEAFTGAFGELRDAIGQLDAGALYAPAESALRELAGALDGLDLDRLGERLDAAQAEVAGALDRLEGALLEVLALVRSAFDAVRDALSAATSALGETGPDGRFRFHAERQVEEVLDRARSALRDDVRPLLEGFRTTIEDALGQVTGALGGVTAELEAARAQLGSALEDAAADLESVDPEALVTQLAERVGAAVDGLVAIDFDTVVDPVVAQIEEMRDALRGIDTSTLNDLLRAALSAAAEVLRAIDFPADITAVLMGELDELLAEPVTAIGGLQAGLDAAVADFAALEPAQLTAPLRPVFEQATAAFDELKLETLAAPLTEWHERARSALDGLMPEALLAPLVQAHEELVRVVASISPEGVAGELEQALSAAAGELQRLEPAALVGGLGEAMDGVRRLVDSLAPDAVLAPAVTAYDAADAHLTGVDPTAVLAPLGELRGALSDGLEALTQADAEQLAGALEPLRDAAQGIDPQAAFARAAAAAAGAEQRLAALDLETLLAAARRSQAQAADAGGPGAARVAVLAPLDEPRITRALADLRRQRDALAAAFAQPEPSDALVAGYAEARSVAEALVPTWAQGTPTVEGLRGALLWVDPETVAGELRGAYDDVLTQWRQLDPRRLEPALAELHREVGEALSALDVGALAGRVQAVLGDAAGRLEALDLDVVGTDARALQQQVAGLVEALDPRPAIERLSGIADEVRGLLDELDPAALLASLEQRARAARELLDVLDPDALAETLEPAFRRLREMLTSIDLSAALAPLTSRLDALRDELEAALRRTERALRELLAAIPG